VFRLEITGNDYDSLLVVLEAAAQLFGDTIKLGISSGSIVSDYGLDDRAIGVRSPAGAKDFSYSLFAQTDSGAHPASCTNGTGGPLPAYCLCKNRIQF
jgi:hypothetical protein